MDLRPIGQAWPDLPPPDVRQTDLRLTDLLPTDLRSTDPRSTDLRLTNLPGPESSNLLPAVELLLAEPALIELVPAESL
ncbi:MAG TPA: hypothetical protein VNO31_44125 [Umezawaea sp.]|nr:hypothetical protein [Umezawaea sp.]